MVSNCLTYFDLGEQQERSGAGPVNRMVEKIFCAVALVFKLLKVVPTIAGQKTVLWSTE